MISVRATLGATSPRVDRASVRALERLGAEQGDIAGSGLGLSLSKRLVELMLMAHARPKLGISRQPLLRTPLNAVPGFAQLLGLNVLRPEQREAVDHIQRAGELLPSLIDEVLAPWKTEPLPTSDCTVRVPPIGLARTTEPV